MDEEETKRPWWRRYEFAGVTAVATTVAFLLIGQSVEQFAARLGQPLSETARTAQPSPRLNAIDYTATGSLKGATVVIGPCDTHKP